MTRISTFATIAAFAVALATPALAKTDCDEGFRKHMSAMSIYTQSMSGYELADAVRKSLDAYDSCKAGDDFSPHGVWDQILADMKAKASK